jgi:hypothetical protein
MFAGLQYTGAFYATLSTLSNTENMFAGLQYTGICYAILSS